MSLRNSVAPIATRPALRSRKRHYGTSRKFGLARLLSTGLVGSVRDRRHSHHRAWSAPSRGFSRSPPRFRVRVPIQWTMANRVHDPPPAPFRRLWANTPIGPPGPALPQWLRSG